MQGYLYEKIGNCYEVRRVAAAALQNIVLLC